MKEYDAIIAGGSLGGVMSAFSLSKNGHRVLLVEETDWIGGQLTSQGVPSDEHDYIESTGSTKTYRDFRDKIRDYYRNHPNIIDEIKNKQIFNPGGGWVSKNAHEPTLSHDLFNEMLKEYVDNGTLTIMLNAQVVDAKYNNNSVENITISQLGEKTTFKAKYFVDGTDNGDLLPITKTNYVT